MALAVLPAAARAAQVGPQRAVTKPPTTVGFWAGESVPGTDWKNPDTYWNQRSTRAYTPRLWRVLKREQTPLYFNLRFRRDFGPVPAGQPQRSDGLRIIRRANQLGVPVWAWILVPFDQGYWAWEGGAPEHFKAVRALLKWAEEKHVRLRGIALDPEPPLNTPFESSASIMGGGVFAPVFESAIDPNAQCAGWRGYANIVRWAARRGVRVVAAPMPAALDDFDDGQLALQDAAQFVLPSAPWRRLYFQVYRSVFHYYSGHDPGSGVITSYLESARRRFGTIGQVSLGSAGRRAYKRLPALIHDVRLAATLGAREVPIYSLERTLGAYGGPQAIARLAAAGRHPFTGSSASQSVAPTDDAAKFRATVRRADKAVAAATLPVTTDRGAGARPNPWPEPCA